MADALIRSNVERTFFKLLNELPESQQRLVEARANPKHYESARDAPLLGWTPLGYAVGLRDTVRKVVGDDEQFVRLMKEWALLSITRPPFKVLGEAILRIYDREPGSLLRAYERVWNTIYRQVSSYGVEREQDGHALVVEDPSV